MSDPTPPADVAAEIGSLSTGFGVLVTALFPFALPGLLLALPLVLPLLPLAGGLILLGRASGH
jgi:thiol:disulfide interchange protein